MADDVQFQFGANASGLANATAAVKTQFGELNNVTNQLSASFGKLGTVTSLLFTGLGLVGLDSWVRGLAQSGVEAEKLSAALGITGGQLFELKSAAALAGTDIEALSMAMLRLSLGIQKSTRDAFTPQAAALKVLGLNAKDLIGLPADEFFNKLAEAVSKFNPSMNLTNALMLLGVRNAGQLIAALSKGPDTLKNFTEQMARTKIGQEGFFRAAADTHMQLLFMDSAVEGLNKQLFLALKPTLDAIIIRTREFAISVRESIAEGGTWAKVVSAIGGAMKLLVNTLQLLTLVWNSFLIIMANSWGYVLKGEYSMEKLRETAKKLSDELGVELTETLKKLGEVWKETTKITNENQPGLNAAAVDLEARKALEIQMKAIDQQIALVESGFERTKVFYDRDVMQLQKTELEKINATIQSSAARDAAEIALLEKKKSLYGLDVVQRQDIENQITNIVEKGIIERARLQNDAIREIQAQWGNFFNTIQSSFTSQLRGLLQGTTTWKNAMKAIFTDIVVWAISEFTKLAIIKPLIAALSDAFAPVEIFTNILKMIMKMIGQVFAGATAFFAPTLGPAAPAAGAAVAAATEATALSYDTGAWSVPQTARALVHRDEMILPVDFASAVRSALTGGSFGGASNMTVSIQAWDAASVARWLRSGGADLLARAVSAQYNQNPTIRPRY